MVSEAETQKIKSNTTVNLMSTVFYTVFFFLFTFEIFTKLQKNKIKSIVQTYVKISFFSIKLDLINRLDLKYKIMGKLLRFKDSTFILKCAGPVSTC